MARVGSPKGMRIVGSPKGGTRSQSGKATPVLMRAEQDEEKSGKRRVRPEGPKHPRRRSHV